jgi:hypothetical protein
MRQLIEDLISAMEYHVEQTRPIHSTTVALQAAREALRAQPTPVESVAVKHMMGWVEALKRQSDYGQHMRIPGLNAGACFELAIELEQFINTTPPAAPVQEPEYVYTCNGCDTLYREDDVSCDCTVHGLMQFTRHILMPDTTPPAAQRTWAGLTTEDMATCINEPAWDLVLRKAEQILKEKNT